MEVKEQLNLCCLSTLFVSKPRHGYQPIMKANIIKNNFSIIINKKKISYKSF